MARSYRGLALLPLVGLLTGCSAIGDKNASLSVVYGVTAVLSLMLLAGYCCFAKKRDHWHILLFSCVVVVNAGYFALAISQSLAHALMANRLAYLGSVFLPLSMFMIILRVTHLRYRKWVPGLLLGLGVVVFLIAASPGILDIYYASVTFEKLEGVTILNKVYGPLHGIYLVYLLGYFAAMVISIVHATLADKLDSIVHAVILAAAVFVNIGVWLIEQLVRIDFEILSVSYIISESFLLGLNLLMAESQRQKASPAPTPPPEPVDAETAKVFAAGLALLTPKERQLYECYVAGMTTDVILQELSIKENTLKFHSKNLYGKLGVNSRKQLMQLHRSCTEKQH